MSHTYLLFIWCINNTYLPGEKLINWLIDKQNSCQFKLNITGLHPHLCGHLFTSHINRQLHLQSKWKLLFNSEQCVNFFMLTHTKKHLVAKSIILGSLHFSGLYLSLIGSTFYVLKWPNSRWSCVCTTVCLMVCENSVNVVWQSIWAYESCGLTHRKTNWGAQLVNLTFACEAVSCSTWRGFCYHRNCCDINGPPRAPRCTGWGCRRCHCAATDFLCCVRAV